DWASPGEVRLTKSFSTSLGIGGREPAKKLVEAYYGSRTPSGSYKGCNAYKDYRELLDKERGLDAVYVATPDHWHAPIAIAAMRPYHQAYLPFVWRGWYDFGCGSFGDMGCYSFAGLFKILDLTPPTSVEACSGESYEETFPQASIVHLDFPEHSGRPSLRLS